MYIVLGATGHVGSAVADALIRTGDAVTVVTRDESKVQAWRARGAAAAVLDMTDADALRTVFRQGRRAFLLNPPAAPSTNTDREEHRTFGGIVQALDQSGLEKVVLESTYGAQSGDAVGDLSVLYDFEQALAAQPIPVTVLRAAYYMSNWDALLDAARQGTLPTMYPPDLALPMVAPADLGTAAARLIREAPDRTGIHYVEGPARHSANDVADAFAQALGRDVAVSTTSRDQWEAAYRKQGFSASAAAAYARMTAISVDGKVEMPLDPECGTTTLTRYIDDLVREKR